MTGLPLHARVVPSELFLPEVDYLALPGFDVGDEAREDERVETALDAIEKRVAAFVGDVAPRHGLLRRRSLPASLVRDLERGARDLTHAVVEVAGPEHRAQCEALAGRIFVELQYYLHQFAMARDGSVDRLQGSPVGAGIVTDLDETGLAVRSPEPSTKRLLVEAAAPYAAAVRARQPELTMDSTLAAIDLGSDEAAGNAFKSLFRELELPEAASAYLGYDVVVPSQVILQVSRPSDIWWKRRYADLGLAPSRSANLHYDSDNGIVNVILYLSDVTEEAGAFTYIPGSHRWDRDFFRWISGKAVPFVAMPVDESTRRRFLRIPRRLRHLSHFGDDLLDGTEMQESIWSRRSAVTSTRGDVMVFDPQGLHRGGMVQEGERVAIQLAFRPKGRPPARNLR